MIVIKAGGGTTLDVLMGTIHGLAGPGPEPHPDPFGADFRSLLPTPDRRKPSLRHEVFPVIRGMLEDSLTVAKAHRPDAIVAHQKTLAAPHVAEKLAIPHVQALTVPMLTPTREFPARHGPQ